MNVSMEAAESATLVKPPPNLCNYGTVSLLVLDNNNTMNLPVGSNMPSGESEYPSIESIRTSPLLPFNEHQVDSTSESDQQQQLVQNINEPEEDGEIVLDRSMRVIDPPTNACSTQVLYAIKLLDEFLSQPSTRQIFDEILMPKQRLPKKYIKKKNRGRDHQPHDDKEPKERPAIFDNIDAIQGIRFIQAGRYEVFVKAHGKETYVFDWLCDHVWSKRVGGNNNNTVDEPLVYKSAIAMKEAILHYAIQQALQDDRIAATTKSMNNISYDNFSLIVSYDPVVAQPQHIDLLYPNFQYGLIITDQSPGTTVYKSPYSIKTISDMKEYVWNDVSDTMFAAMERNAMVTSLISQFGDVLCPNIEQVRYWNAPNDDTSEPPYFCHENSTTDDDNIFLPMGTLLSLPGSEIHAGPSCSKYRTVLFFSACPDITNIIPYHPDTQYFAPLLCCDLISLLWNTLGVEDRCFLLYRLDRSITETKCRHLERHIKDANLIRFIKVITNWEKKKGKCKYTMSKYGKNYTINQYIHAFAARGKQTSAKDIGINVVMDTRNNKKGRTTNSKTVVVNGTENVVFIDTLNRISCLDMVVDFEGEYFPAQIFEHQPTTRPMLQQDPVACSDDPTCMVNGSVRQNVVDVMVLYPTDHTWEGLTYPYTLEWQQDSNATNSDGDHEENKKLFDGTNGILRDNDGVIVPCYPTYLPSVPVPVDSPKRKRKRIKSIIPLSIRPRKRTRATMQKDAGVPKKMSVEPMESLLRTGTKNPQAVDVLCGKGGYHNYAGNRSFIEAAQLFGPAFKRGSLIDREFICDAIIRSIHETNGRFLRRNAATGLWSELDDAGTRERCFGALSKTAASAHPICEGSGQTKLHRLFGKYQEEGTIACLSTAHELMSEHPTDEVITVVPSIKAYLNAVNNNTDSTKGIEVPRDADVLSGYNFSHPGNLSFVKVVKLFYPSFEKGSEIDKIQVIDLIIRSVHNADGRFLRKNTSTGLWYELGDANKWKRCVNALANAKKSMRPIENHVHTQKDSNDTLLHQTTRTTRNSLRHHDELYGSSDKFQEEGSTSYLSTEQELIPERPVDEFGSCVHSNKSCLDAVNNTTYSTKEIVAPRAVDVISGGNHTYRPGNQSFIEVVKLCSPAYGRGSAADKIQFIDSIIRSVHDTNGRFLRKNTSTGLWYELNDTDTRKRCANALSNVKKYMRPSVTHIHAQHQTTAKIRDSLHQHDVLHCSSDLYHQEEASADYLSTEQELIKERPINKLETDVTSDNTTAPNLVKESCSLLLSHNTAVDAVIPFSDM